MSSDNRIALRSMRSIRTILRISLMVLSMRHILQLVLRMNTIRSMLRARNNCMNESEGRGSLQEHKYWAEKLQT